MDIRIKRTGIVLTLLAVPALAFTTAAGSAQQAAVIEGRQQLIGATTRNLTELRAWDAFVTSGAREGRLLRRGDYSRDARGRRRVESFVQQHGGLEIYGADIARTVENGVSIAVSGKLYGDVDVSVVPTLDSNAARSAIETIAGSPIVESDTPQLMILPYLGGRYLLVYRATARNAFEYFVDAHSGEVVQQLDLRTYQSAVGLGTGVLGDRKKVSATTRSGTFIALDALRPAQIATLDTRGSVSAFNRLSGGGPSTDADFASSANNTWTSGGVVDTHVHTGWTYDYFFKRHQYRGLDDQNGAIYSSVTTAALLPNNAFFISPPFGPNGGPGLFYGTTTDGVPMTTLDIVGHEAMHGVTFFSLRRRTGGGLGSSFVTAAGPAGCAAPFWCSGSNYILVSNHAGAINEGMSDIFGTAVEFMFHPPGDGPQRADYTSGEDLGPGRFIRPLADPQAFPMAVGGVYPDHRSNQILFPMIFVSNGPFLCNNVRCDIFPMFFSGGRVIAQRNYVSGQGLGPTDNGAVHLNMTILSHAYFLAIEGGRNRTSGLQVQGVGQANRDQIERVFFMAVRDLLPRAATFTDVANALRQAAAAVHGAGSNAARAVDQALTAVGM